MKAGEIGLIAAMSILASSIALSQTDQGISEGSSNSQERSSHESSAKLTASDTPTLEVRERVPAAYPQQARGENLQGVVLVKLRVSETGDVEAVELASGPTVFVPAAVKAAKQWKFKPFLRNGQPVKVSTTIPFEFKLKGQVPDWGTRTPSANILKVSEQEVIPGKLIQSIKPEFPTKARLLHVGGTVLLDAIIGKDGTIRFLHVIQGHPLFAKAAMDAVKTWRFTPYTRAGEPIDVDTEITVNFYP
jgi:TonB family protein